MKKRNFILLVFLAFLLVLSVFLAVKTARKQACFEKACFKVEIADSDYEFSRGLMFRRQLPENSGMLFVFKDEDYRTFWMKNTKMPLDMVFVGANNEVVSVFENALPCVEDPCPLIYSQGRAKYVLEINAGLARKYGIKEGEKMDCKN